MTKSSLEKVRTLIVFGTRPEAIKLAPLIKAFEQNDLFDLKVCATGQHKELVEPILQLFDIRPDYLLDVMKPNQTLSNLTADLLSGLKTVFDDFEPNLVFVQGDTTTALAGALTGFYHQARVAHIEAGLRSQDLYSPFPEEGNRKLIGHICNYHFAPTDRAVETLKNEGLEKNVFQVGNSVIDSLFLCLEALKKNEPSFDFLKPEKKTILVTAHRRESFGDGFLNICNSLKKIAEERSDVEIVYATHLNPNVRKPVFDILDGIDNVHLIEPLGYLELVFLMSRSHLILTDSGGIQEEAPSLGKPLLVMRDVTERTEGIDAGTALLVGTDPEKIYQETLKLLDDEAHYSKMSKALNPYGDGKTSERVLEILSREFSN